MQFWTALDSKSFTIGAVAALELRLKLD